MCDFSVIVAEEWRREPSGPLCEGSLGLVWKPDKGCKPGTVVEMPAISKDAYTKAGAL